MAGTTGRPGFRMGGMTFKGESPLSKTRNWSKISKSIKDSKFGESKLGEVVGDITEKVGIVQGKFIAGKKKLGLSTKGYDATLTSDTNVDSKDAQEDASESTTSSVPTTPDAGVNLERVKVGPVVKRIKKKKSPTRDYKTGYYGVKKNK
jgi:hypothetical protein|tara:strand:+ start:371 stop:817 length:447 start_codon:yes stop_codon:yes gene_type:complete